VDNYIVKPHSFDEFSHTISIILADWLGEKLIKSGLANY